MLIFWSFNGPAEIQRTSNINLNGANGANAPATIGDPGRNGTSGLPGSPGRDGQAGLRMPQVFIFAQQMFWNGQQASPSDVRGVVLFSFDGYPGGNGGDGGRGGNGTNGSKGEPARDGWLDCAAGPGWGGRGGNAGVGGNPGYGANGGDAAAMYMFVDPQQGPVFKSVTVSLKGGTLVSMATVGGQVYLAEVATRAIHRTIVPQQVEQALTALFRTLAPSPKYKNIGALMLRARQ